MQQIEEITENLQNNVIGPAIASLAEPEYFQSRMDGSTETEIYFSHSGTEYKLELKIISGNWELQKLYQIGE